MTQHKPWRTLSYSQVLDTPYLKIRCEQVAVPDGPIIPDYYIIENHGWVGIVPLTADGRFLINKQYKHGIGEVVLEFPAGGIDVGEEDTPQQTARRELMEETGTATTITISNFSRTCSLIPPAHAPVSGGISPATCAKPAHKNPTPWKSSKICWSRHENSCN